MGKSKTSKTASVLFNLVCFDHVCYGQGGFWYGVGFEGVLCACIVDVVVLFTIIVNIINFESKVDYVCFVIVIWFGCFV